MKVVAGTRIIQLQEQVVATREAVREHPGRDDLTGISNQREIMTTLQRELHRAAREGQPLAVVLADLDHFKRVNVTYGRRAGDAVLRTTARRMSSGMRSYDGLGRYGGDEFLMVVPIRDRSSALRFAERIRSRIAEAPVVWETGPINVTASLGVAFYEPPAPAHAQMLLDAASRALNRAKSNGGNLVVGAWEVGVEPHMPIPAVRVESLAPGAA